MWELVRHRDGRTVVLGLGWWTAALCSIALANVPSSNRIAGVVVFGATVFGALSAVTAPFGLDRSMLGWVATGLLVAFVAFGSIAASMRTFLFADVPDAVAYTQTPAEVPAIVAGAVGSFFVLYAFGCVLRVGVARGWSAIGRVRSVRRDVFAGRTER